MAVDRVAQILSRLPEQYRDLPGWEGILTDIAAEIQELEDAHEQLLTLRGVNTATGAALEDIGRFVGEPPTGLDDEAYRRRIRARIFTNRSRGTVEELLTIARLILTDGTTTPDVVLVRHAVASVVVRVLGVTTAADVADILISFLRAATKGGAAGGVRVILESALGDVPNLFAFDTPTAGAAGALDVGVFADAHE